MATWGDLSGVRLRILKGALPEKWVQPLAHRDDQEDPLWTLSMSSLKRGNLTMEFSFRLDTTIEKSHDFQNLPNL